MKKLIIFVFIVLVIIPFVIAFSPYADPYVSTFLDRLSIAQAFFTLYAFFIAITGVWEYIKNSRKHIKPEMYVNSRMKALHIKGDSFPSHVDIDFYVLNDGNISLPKASANYTILVPKELHIKPINGVKNDVGHAIVPGHRIYDSNPNFQALGGEIPVKVYPKRMRKLFVLNIVFPKPGTYVLRYYFTTDEGFFPKDVILDQMNEPIRNLGQIVLHVK